MRGMKIGVLTYTTRHRKTYDVLCLLKANGYDTVSVYAQPMRYKKSYIPLIQHRPDVYIGMPESEELCKNFGYGYKQYSTVQQLGDEEVFLLCGAGLLPNEFVSQYRIINAHPGYIPYARGLDALKWEIYEGLPIGVTTHFLGEHIDAGEIIERREIAVEPYDTFHSLAYRVYETEIGMLVGALKKIDDPHDFVIPNSDALVRRRMPHRLEQQLFERLEKRKEAHGIS